MYDGIKWAINLGPFQGKEETRNSPGSSEYVLRIGADSIDGTVMPSDVPNRCEVINIPDLHGSTTAGAQQHGPARHKGQSTHPIFMCIGDLLETETQ